MNSDARDTLLSVFRDARVASLGTIHAGEPAVSMVPFALLPDGAALVIHVSGLSAHTADMLASPRVSALVIARQTADVLPQALPRVTVRADAIRLAETDFQYESARSAYLERFPDAEAIFGLGDFSLFLLRPLSARVIGGFGRAATVSAQDLSDTLASIQQPLTNWWRRLDRQTMETGLAFFLSSACLLSPSLSVSNLGGGSHSNR